VVENKNIAFPALHQCRTDCSFPMQVFLACGAAAGGTRFGMQPAHARRRPKTTNANQNVFSVFWFEKAE